MHWNTQTDAYFLNIEIMLTRSVNSEKITKIDDLNDLVLRAAVELV